MPDQVHFDLPLVAAEGVNMPRMPSLPRDAVPWAVSASPVVSSVSPLVDLSRGSSLSWPQATSAGCQEAWCREVLSCGGGVWVYVGVVTLSLARSLRLLLFLSLLSLCKCVSTSISEHWCLCPPHARRDGVTGTTQHTTSVGILLQTHPSGTPILPCRGLSQHKLPMSKQSRRAWCLFRCV